MYLLSYVYFRQESEDLISTGCTEQAGKFPFWMLRPDGAAKHPTLLSLWFSLSPGS